MVIAVARATVLAFLLLAPGYALSLALGVPTKRTALERLALALALSLASPSLALLAAMVLGLHLGRWPMTAVLGLAAGAAVYGLVAQRQRLLPRSRSVALQALSFVAVALLILAVRLLVVRNLAAPLWVDSVHHATVVALLVRTGRVPADMAPLIDGVPFSYHFGFHALAAVVCWLTGVAAPTAVLLAGQIVSAVAAVTCAALAQRLTRSRLATLLSLIISGLAFSMPGYYVSWGRYTHLAGLALLPAVLLLVLEYLEARERGRRALLLAGLALTTLFLMHYRVTVFLIAYLITDLMVGLALPRRLVGRSHLRRLLYLALVTLALSSVWLWTLLSRTVLRPGVPEQMRASQTFNAMPWHLLASWPDRLVLALAGGGLALGLWRRQRQMVTLGLWVAALFALANLPVLGLPASTALNNGAVVISLYLPAAILASYLLASGYAWIAPRVRRRKALVLHVALGALVLAAVVWGTTRQLAIVNTNNVILDPRGLSSLDWIARSTPPESRFLISPRLWQENIYVGADSGYWITPFTGRQTFPPPALYPTGRREAVASINRLASLTIKTADPDAPSFLHALAGQGITHIYVTRQGGPLRPEPFLSSRHYRLLYDDGFAWIFAFSP